MRFNHGWTLMNTDFRSESVSSSRDDGGLGSVILIFPAAFGSPLFIRVHSCASVVTYRIVPT